MIYASVPASTANLGPAFDTAAMALSLRMEAYARPRGDGFRLRFTGSEQPTHDGIERKIREGAMHATDGVLPSLDALIKNEIPLGVGLGSSTAALLCGMLIARAARGETTDPSEAVRLVARLEGHADNAAAAVYGGACFVATRRDEVFVHKTAVSRALRLALVVPSAVVDTAAARRTLPQIHRLDDVVHNLQRSALLAAALASGTLHALPEVFDDRLHERYRAALLPGLDEALKVSADGAFGIALSGAGPAVLVIGDRDPSAIAARVRRKFEEAGMTARVLFPTVENAGMKFTIRSRRRAAAAAL